jgi:uncharacterized protein (DUF433 family)
MNNINLIDLEISDVNQILAALESRIESWQYTAEWYRNHPGDVEMSIDEYLGQDLHEIEDCRDFEEAEAIANDLKAVYQRVEAAYNANKAMSPEGMATQEIYALLQERIDSAILARKGWLKVAFEGSQRQVVVECSKHFFQDIHVHAFQLFISPEQGAFEIWKTIIDRVRQNFAQFNDVEPVVETPEGYATAFESYLLEVIPRYRISDESEPLSIRRDPRIRVMRTPGVCGGSPRIRDTEVPISLIVEKMAAGWSIEDLIFEHSISEGDIEIASNYGR